MSLTAPDLAISVILVILTFILNAKVDSKKEEFIKGHTPLDIEVETIVSIAFTLGIGMGMFLVYLLNYYKTEFPMSTAFAGLLAITTTLTYLKVKSLKNMVRYEDSRCIEHFVLRAEGSEVEDV